MWRELVESICSECKFAPPASDLAMKDIEAALGVRLPPELRDLLLESNGIGDTYSVIVMSAEEILMRNLEMRADAEQDDLYMSFESCLFFADAGNGDLFFFPIQGNGKVNNPFIFVWDHESDSRRWVANNLKRFVEGWFSGQLHV